MTFSDLTDQRTLTESATAAIDDTPETPTGLLDRAQQHATNVAAEHFPDLPVETIDWEVSHRAQRQAGVTKYDPATEKITIVLTWAAYEQHGWKQFSSTVRHELIHAWQYYEFGDADHGAIFTHWTDRLDTSQPVSDLPHYSGDLPTRKWIMLVGNRFTVAGGIVISSTSSFQSSHPTNIIIQITFIPLSTVERGYGNIDGI